MVQILVAGLLVVICTILNRLGGSINKNYRRLGIGIALAIYGLLLGNWWALLCIGTSQLFRAPITLKGDSIPEYWFNWLWLPVAGFLYGLVVFPLSLPSAWLEGLALAGVFSTFFTLIVALSNIRATAEIFKWDRVEILYGLVLGLFAVMLNRLRGKKNA